MNGEKDLSNHTGANYPSHNNKNIWSGRLTVILAVAITAVVCIALTVVGYSFLGRQYKDKIARINQQHTDEIEALEKQHADYAASINEYNLNKDGYLSTLDELAQDYDMSLDELKEEYSIPDDMRGDTIAAIATMYMPAEVYVKRNYNLSFDMVVGSFGLSDDPRISPEMPYGEFDKILNELKSPEETASAEGETVPVE